MPASAAKRVLVVDDDRAVLRLAERLLRARGYEVTVAESVAEAVSQLAARPFDVVLADKNLPNASGLELARAVRAQWPTVALVLMTAHVEPPVLRTSLIDGYLAKPFRRIDEVPEALEAAVERRSRTVQLAQLESTLASVKRGLDKDGLE